MMMRGEAWGGGEMPRRKGLLLHRRRHWSTACCVLQLLLLLLNALQSSQLMGCLCYKLLNLRLKQQRSVLACNWSWVEICIIFGSSSFI